MKKPILFLLIIFLCKSGLYSQQVNAIDLVGTWDQNIRLNARTMIFEDLEHVKFSVKGRTGTTKTYYYTIDNTQSPAMLTVDFKPNHKKHRNQFLIKFINQDKIELQVLGKHDIRDHFNESKVDDIVVLERRK